MKRTLMLSLIVLLLSACKEKNEAVVISLKGKWTAENIVYKYYENNVLKSTSTDPAIGTTFNFQDNGILVITNSSGVESFPYNIKPGSKVEFDGGIYEIRNLTGITVTICLNEDIPPGWHLEQNINLKR